MTKSQILTVEWHEIVVFSHEWNDFICLTDIMKSVDANAKVEKRMSSRSTVDFLGTWEAMHNPDFNYSMFGEIRSESWNNTFTISVTKRKEKTNAIGIFSKTGKFGWTYAHKDIAFEFASWLSPQFKLYIIKEFQRLKKDEQEKLAMGRDIKRLITKANYRIHTDAIKSILEPKVDLSKRYLLYSSEAEVLNIAVFGITSKDWAEQNPKKAKNGNIRDEANVAELTVLSNLEVLNAEMIKNNIAQDTRLNTLIERAKEQLETLWKLSSIKQLQEKSDKQILQNKWKRA